MTVDNKIQALTEILKDSNNIVFFGGAGVSTASGIPDFRSASGLWNQRLCRNVSPEELVSHSFFVRYPEDFFEFYKKHLIYPQAKPNGCHLALARLGQLGKLSAVVTQNIDGLHQAAGSPVVHELHGSVHRNYCQKCGAFYDAAYILQEKGVPRCRRCGGIVKPDVVLYEESLDEKVLDASVSAIERADTLIIGGTSLVVYPAAGLRRYFRGKHLVLINKSETDADAQASLVIREDIASVMETAVSQLLTVAGK